MQLFTMLYKKLLTLYPRGFRERLEGSMQQTFNDLYKEREQHPEHESFSFVFWMFSKTFIGIIREHILLMKQESIMKTILSNPTSTAITSFILCLPLAVPYVIIVSDMQPLIQPLKNLLTTDGQQINTLGRIVFFGGLILLPVAFLLNLQPILIREGPDQKRTFPTVNLIVGGIILLLITFTWGALLVEEIYCLQGIRCD